MTRHCHKFTTATSSLALRSFTSLSLSLSSRCLVIARFDLCNHRTPLSHVGKVARFKFSSSCSPFLSMLFGDRPLHSSRSCPGKRFLFPDESNNNGS